jgi:hypothetical protein
LVVTAAFFDLDPRFQQRIAAAEPVAMKVHFERLFREHWIEFRYHVTKWCAWVRRRSISVPPPVNAAMFAICLHELAHCLIPGCPGTPPHRGQILDRSHACLECERGAWMKAQELVPFTREMHDRMRRALTTYRYGASAPSTAQREADRHIGSLAYRVGVPVAVTSSGGFAPCC